MYLGTSKAPMILKTLSLEESLSFIFNLITQLFFVNIKHQQMFAVLLFCAFKRFLTQMYVSNTTKIWLNNNNPDDIINKSIQLRQCYLLIYTWRFDNNTTSDLTIIVITLTLFHHKTDCNPARHFLPQRARSCSMTLLEKHKLGSNT